MTSNEFSRDPFDDIVANANAPRDMEGIFAVRVSRESAEAFVAGQPLRILGGVEYPMLIEGVRTDRSGVRLISRFSEVSSKQGEQSIPEISLPSLAFHGVHVALKQRRLRKQKNVTVTIDTTPPELNDLIDKYGPNPNPTD